MAVLRHGYPQCERFAPKAAVIEHANYSDIVWLDEGFRVLPIRTWQVAHTDRSRTQTSRIGLSDCRIFIQDEDTMFLTYSSAGNRFVVNSFTLEPHGQDTILMTRDWLFMEKGRNMGLLGYRGRVWIMPWVAHRSALPPAANVTAAEAAHPGWPQFLVAADQDVVRVPAFKTKLEPLHGSINPIPLDDHGGILLIAHQHLTRGQGGAAWSSSYVHYFLILESSEPFALVALSAPFCLPARRHADQCEEIQFIQSAVRIGTDHLLLAYGINDCESALAFVSVRQALAYARGQAPALTFY